MAISSPLFRLGLHTYETYVTMDDMSTSPAPPAGHFTSGQAARELGISLDTLRRWEADGVTPPADRTPTGHRRYTPADLLTIAAIRDARKAAA